MIHRDAAAGALGAVICRAEDARALGQIGLELRACPGVVAEGDHVGPGAEDHVRLPGRDADDVGVLAVYDGEGDVIFLLEGLEPLFQTVETRLPADISHRQYFHDHGKALPTESISDFIILPQIAW